MQQAGQTKSSVNGFGRHKLQNAKANSIRLTSVGKGGGFESSPRDRLFYVTACLIGHQVEVQVLDGSVFSGILHATNADKDFDIVLKMARLVKDGSRGQNYTSESLSKPASRTFIIPAKELVQVTSKGVHLTPDDVTNEYQLEKQHELMTDSCISQSRPIEGERELERWVPDDDTPECPELDNIFDGHWNRLLKGWNQFEVNETLFGVKSTFNEELYTTKLERGPQMRDLEREALRIAKEIEGEETHDLHLAEERGAQLHGNIEIDEETRYSSVFRGVDDSGCDDCEDILLDSRNDETFQDVSSSVMVKSLTNMSSKRSNDGGQEPSRTSSMDEAQLSLLSTCGDISLTGCDNQAKQLSAEHVYVMDDSRVHEIQISEQTGTSCSNTDVGKQMPAEEGSEVLKSEATCISHETKKEPSDMSGLSSDMPEGQGKVRRKAQSANSCTHSSVVSTSDRGGTALVSAASGLSNSSSEFKLNPNAKSFVPSQSPLRPASPVSDGSFYYPTNVTPVQHMHGMPVGVGIGPSYAGHQPVMFNHQVAPTPQPYFHPNGPQYGQQMIIGHPRQVVYMPTYPPEYFFILDCSEQFFWVNTGIG
nr:polyadenylate-binding protein-interacting protein 3-like isoform X1 [Ipomoea batatas]